MTHDIVFQLSRPNLEALAAELDAERLPMAPQPSRLQMVDERFRQPLAAWLAARASEGMLARHVALMLRLLSDERRAQQAVADRTQLVWTGVENHNGRARDTAVVVQELFRAACTSVLVATYALDYFDKGTAVFGDLAQRMDALPDLDVRLFVNVQRHASDGRPDDEVVAEFVARFKKNLWSGHRLPQVYFDPRALDVSGASRTCLHAKCVVIDNRRTFVTSANFTEAAHNRNIEAGVLIDDESVASRLRDQFDALVRRKVLRRII